MNNEDKLQGLKEKEQLKTLNEVFKDEDFKKMWMKMHTPWVRNHKKVRRNEKCPFCNSGIKYKLCECYTKRFENEYSLDTKHTKGWR